MNRLLHLLVVTFALSFTGTSARAAEADLKSDLAKMQGKWKGSIVGDDRKSVWSLEIKGAKSTLTVKNSNGDELVKAECDFKLEQHGKFRAFTYSNLKWLSGDNAGQTELTGGKSRSSLYKFKDGSTFSTIGGYRDDSEEEQWQIKWEKE